MTLLLGARGREHVVILSDGMSFLQTEDELSVQRSDLPKQFQIDEAPAVIAHHGQNKLGSVGVRSYLESDPIQDALADAWTSGLNRVLATAMLELDNVVTQTLEAVPLRKLFGLWFAGFWPDTDIPDIAEVAWSKKSPTQTRVTCHPLGDLSIGGGGRKFLNDVMSDPIDDKFTYKRIMREPAEYSMEFLKALYREALKRQKESDETVFGGQAIMSLITRDGVDTGPVDIGE